MIGRLVQRLRRIAPRGSIGVSAIAGAATDVAATLLLRNRWMAPEVIRHEPYSRPADVYSFGEKADGESWARFGAVTYGDTGAVMESCSHFSSKKLFFWVALQRGVFDVVRD